MSSTAARAVLRPTRLALRRAPGRYASTTSEASSTASEASSKAKETASNIKSKASEGLSKVQSSAGPALSKASAAATDAAGRVGAKTGGFISRIQSIIPPTIYYAKVAAELSKLVFKGQKMHPPTAQQLQTYYQPVLSALRNPSTLVAQNPGVLNPQRALGYVRGLTTQQLAGAGVILAEVIGFFTVGEMIGRLKIVGYRGQVSHEH